MTTNDIAFYLKGKPSDEIRPKHVRERLASVALYVQAIHSFLPSTTIDLLQKMSDTERLVLTRVPNQGAADLDDMVGFMVKCCQTMSYFGWNMTGNDSNPETARDYTKHPIRDGEHDPRDPVDGGARTPAYVKLHRAFNALADSMAGFGFWPFAVADKVYALFRECVRLCSWTLGGQSEDDELSGIEPSDNKMRMRVCVGIEDLASAVDALRREV